MQPGAPEIAADDGSGLVARNARPVRAGRLDESGAGVVLDAAHLPSDRQGVDRQRRDQRAADQPGLVAVIVDGTHRVELRPVREQSLRYRDVVAFKRHRQQLATLRTHDGCQL